MKKTCFYIAALLSVVFITTSCSKDIDNDVPDSEIISTSAPSIIWNEFAEGSMLVGFEGAMDIFWDVFKMDVFIITHPDSTSIGIIRCDDPTAEVFRKRFENTPIPSKEIIYITDEKDSFKKWQDKMEKEGYVVVSRLDEKGFYYGIAYTKEEWDHLFPPKP